jgi:hypothetical protein
MNRNNPQSLRSLRIPYGLFSLFLHPGCSNEVAQLECAALEARHVDNQNIRCNRLRGSNLSALVPGAAFARPQASLAPGWSAWKPRRAHEPFAVAK